MSPRYSTHKTYECPHKYQIQVRTLVYPITEPMNTGTVVITLTGSCPWCRLGTSRRALVRND